MRYREGRYSRYGAGVIFKGIKLSRAKILDWITRVWKPLIHHVSRVIMLVNGWIYFHFLSEESKQVIASRYWVIGVGSWFYAIGIQHLIPGKRISREEIYEFCYRGGPFTVGILGLSWSWVILLETLS